MKLLIVLCLVAGAFAAQDCPANSHYNSCGTACPLTCKNYQNPPKACVLMCVPGCHCDEGYVKAEDGSCVLPEQCEALVDEAVCGENQVYKQCGSACPLTCENYQNPPKICPAMCVSGCHCQEGFVKTQDGRCVRPEECTSNTNSEVCELPLESGPCMALMHRYGFDKESGKCKKFIYGGCRGNANNFKSLEECERACEDYGRALVRPDCDKAPETGRCRAFVRRYYYDQEAGMCKKFVYGGCGGNKNNFKSEFECYNKCGALHVSHATACQQEKEVGLCKAYMPRFFFNKHTGKCEEFIYGGCGGNSNNFNSLEDCEAVCY